MAKYTVELRYLVSHIDIFDFEYNFYDEAKRKEFEQHFIDYFYFREIGQPTPGRFVQRLKNKMQTVFPFYNELFKSSLIEYDKLNNYDLTETFTQDTTNNGTTSNNSSNTTNTNNSETMNSTLKTSNTPQGVVNLNDNFFDNVEVNSTTNTNEMSGSSSINSNSTMNNDTNITHTLTRKGNIGVQTGSDMVTKHIELQKTLKSIELQFFKECEDLFMLIY